jgi:hypothetical protein
MFGVGPMEMILVPFMIILYLLIPGALLYFLYRLIRLMKKLEEKMDRKD